MISSSLRAQQLYYDNIFIEYSQGQWRTDTRSLLCRNLVLFRKSYNRTTRQISGHLNVENMNSRNSHMRPTSGQIFSSLTILCSARSSVMHPCFWHLGHAMGNGYCGQFRSASSEHPTVPRFQPLFRSLFRHDSSLPQPSEREGPPSTRGRGLGISQLPEYTGGVQDMVIIG